MKKLRLSLVGAYPPPLGGNSVHVKRLAELVGEDLDVRVLDPYGPPSADAPDFVSRCGPPGVVAVVRLVRALQGARSDIVHFHVSALRRFLWAAPLLLLLSTGARRRVLTIHSGSFVAASSALPRLCQWWMRRVLRSFNSIIAVSAEQADHLTDTLDVAEIAIEVLPAYIPQAANSSGKRVAALVEALARMSRS